MHAPARPLGPTEVIGPAFERAKSQLFAPFRWGFWWRMAIVAFFAGEIGGGGGFNIPSGGFPQRTGRGDHFLMLLQGENPLLNPRFLPWIGAAIVAFVVLLFVFLYIHSIFRFILFDSVISGRCRIRETWERRSSVGARFFVWLIFFQLIFLAALVVVIGLPLYSWWRAGVFQHPDEHMGLLVGQGLLLFLAAVVMVIAAAVISLVARDFLIPQMALENISIGEAWNRFRPRMMAEKGNTAGYILLKFLLNIAVSIALGIVAFIWILVLIIPVIIVVAIFAAAGSGTSGPGSLVALAVVVGVLGFVLLVLWFFVFLLLWVPAAIFFQSYALYYFGSRYPALAALLWPESPVPPAITSPDIGPDLPPIPTPA